MGPRQCVGAVRRAIKLKFHRKIIDFHDFLTFWLPRRVEAFDGSGPAEHAIGRCRSARGLSCSSPRVPRGLGWSPTARDGPRAPLGAREWLLEPPGADNLDFGPSFNIFLGFGLFKKKQNYMFRYDVGAPCTLLFDVVRCLRPRVHFA